VPAASLPSSNSKDQQQHDTQVPGAAITIKELQLFVEYAQQRIYPNNKSDEIKRQL